MKPRKSRDSFKRIHFSAFCNIFALAAHPLPLLRVAWPQFPVLSKVSRLSGLQLKFHGTRCLLSGLTNCWRNLSDHNNSDHNSPQPVLGYRVCRCRAQVKVQTCLSLAPKRRLSGGGLEAQNPIFRNEAKPKYLAREFPPIRLLTNRW